MNLMPRLGVIKMGEKKGNGARSLDHFILPTDVESNKKLSPAVVESFREVYGTNPKSLDVYLPSNDINEIIPLQYKRYGRATKLCSSQVHIMPDGKEVHSGKAVSVDPYKKDRTEIACDPKTCTNKANCKLKADLYFLLPKVKGFGIWQISTGSFNGRQNIISKINYIKSLTGGQVAMIPLRLVVIQTKTLKKNTDGTKQDTTVNVVDIDIDSMSIEELLAHAERARGVVPVNLPVTIVDTEDDASEEGVGEPGQEPEGGSAGDDARTLLTKETHKELILSVARMGKNEAWFKDLVMSRKGINDPKALTEEEGKALLEAFKKKITEAKNSRAAQ